MTFQFFLSKDTTIGDYAPGFNLSHLPSLNFYFRCNHGLSFPALEYLKKGLLDGALYYLETNNPEGIVIYQHEIQKLSKIFNDLDRQWSYLILLHTNKSVEKCLVGGVTDSRTKSGLILPEEKPVSHAWGTSQ